MMPTVVANYHARMEHETNSLFNRNEYKYSMNNQCISSLDQQLNYETNNNDKFEFPSYPSQQHPYPLAQATHYSLSNNHHIHPSQYSYDLNNNNNYANGQINSPYPFTSAPATPLPQPTTSTVSSSSHTLLGGRFSGGNNNNNTSNVLMLPPSQHGRGNGGSLPDLRTDNGFHSTFSTVSSSPTSENQCFFRSLSPQQNSDGDLYALVCSTIFIREREIDHLFLGSTKTTSIEYWSSENKSKYASTSQSNW